jgi:hypothetical protein
MLRKIIIPVIILLGGFVISYYVANFSGNVIAFIDIPAIIVIAVLPYLYMIGCYGIKNVKQAYKTACTHNTSINERKFATKVLKKLSICIYLFGLIHLSVYLLAECLETNILNGVRVNIALALISIFYMAFLIYCLYIHF